MISFTDQSVRSCFLSIVLMVLFCTALFSQDIKSKSVNVKNYDPIERMMIQTMKQEGSSQKEIDASISEYRNLKSGKPLVSQEDQEEMSKMGIAIPVMPGMDEFPKTISEKDMKQAWIDENRIVPKKDTRRIASIPAIPLSSQNLQTYMQRTVSKVNKAFSAEDKALFEETYQMAINNTADYSNLANMGATLWILGKHKAAIYIQGKICLLHPDNANELNNYAAFLTMAGAEQLAVPILDYLNEVHPNNSTILNNLAQAWFGLGDMDKAEKFADKALFLYGGHPQVNMIKAKIEESKGDTEKAVSHIKKSIKEAYSEEKEEKLRKAGVELTEADITLPLPLKNDALGLSGYAYPPFPKNATEEVYLRRDWAVFRDNLESQAAVLIGQRDVWIAEYQKTAEARQKKNIALIKTSIQQGKKIGQLPLMPFFYKKASLPYKIFEARLKKIQLAREKKLVDFHEYVGEAEAEYDAKITELRKADDEQTGEGLQNEDFCLNYDAAVTNFLSKVNSRYEELTNETLDEWIKVTNEMLYFDQFMKWSEEFEMYKLNYQIGWLEQLGKIKYAETGFFQEETLCKKKVPPKLFDGKLQNFNDVNCQYNSELKLPMMSVISTCDKVTYKADFELLNVKLFKTEIHQDYAQVNDWNQEWWQTASDSFVNCTIEAGVSHGVKVGEGPLKLEAEIGGAGVVEIGREGISNMGVKVSGEIKVGTDMGEDEANIDVTIAGAEATLTVNSGFTVEGKSILDVLNR